jgi:hypothetical protein
MKKIEFAPELDAFVQASLDAFREAGTPPNGLRLADYQRWSFVLSLIGSTDDLLDIGIGMGQFVDAAMRSARFGRVRGVDRKPHSQLRNLLGFEFVSYDLTQPPASLSADVVTCMECLEHIPDPHFDIAVHNLFEIARNRLIVTVPFEEREPLPPYHHQRFDEARLERLFPGAELYQLGNWALADLRR